MTFSPRAIEAAAEAMKLGVCQYCRQPAVGAGGGVVDCNCPYRVWDEPTDKERAQIALTAALAVDGVVLVPVDALSVVLDAAEMYWDEGPFDEGWRSQKLIDACGIVAQSVYATASDREERRLPTPGTEG
jgi:hypothetical protein